MEITRINAYRKSIENIVELQTKNQYTFSSGDILDEIDAENDVDVFITKHGIDNISSVDDPYKFVPYYGTHAFFKNL